MRMEYTTQEMVDLLNKECNPLQVRNARLTEKIDEQRKVIEHLRRKINESDR